MPTGNGLRFDNDQDVSPCRPKPTQQDPKYPILHSQPRARLFSLEHTQLLTERKDLKAEIVTGTEEGAETGKETHEKWNHADLYHRSESRRLR